jgi:hypothetical protein
MLDKPPAEPEKSETIEKGVGFPQILHDRSRSQGSELHRFVLSLSTGTLAVYFLALTVEAKPALTISQKKTAIAALASVALAVASGLLGMYADTRRNYFWASALQRKENKEERSFFYKRRDRWLSAERISDATLAVAFITGMIFSLTYMILRVLGR